MNPEELIKHMSEVFNKCVEVAKAKNADYSHNDGNAFRNFEAVEFFKIAESKQGIMVRLTDKFMRIAHLLKAEGKVKDESLQDSIEDAINYLAILHAKIASEKK